jgi:hypothetical protein
MSSLSAAFAANRQACLPAAAQIKLCLRVYPGDRWHVDIVPVPMRDGVLDRARLAEQSPLHAAPSRFQLGLIGGAK